MTEGFSGEANVSTIEIKQLSSPAFSLGLFKRKVIYPSSPTGTKTVFVECTAPYCSKTYTQKYPGNTTTFIEHFKSKHKNVLFQMAQEAINSGKLKYEAILGTKLLDGLTNTPKEISEYFEVDEIKSKRKSVTKKKPSYAGCSPEDFKKRFTQFIIGLNIPINVCDDSVTKRMLDGACFGLLNVISRREIMLQLKKMYFQEVGRLKKEFSDHDGRFSLTIFEWKANNDYKFLGITVHCINKSFELKRYNIGLEHIPKKGGDAESLVDSLTKVLRYYNIDDRIISITKDNNSVMKKVVSMFKSLYQGKGVDEKFEGDHLCFGQVCNLSVNSFMAHAFPKSPKSGLNEDFIEENDSMEDDGSMEDEIYSGLPSKIQAFPEEIRKIIIAINTSDFLGSLFDKAVAERKQTENLKKENLKKEKLKIENTTDWLSEFEVIDSLLYFKDQIIEVLNEFNKFSPEEKKRIGISEISEYEWSYLKILHHILYVFVGPKKALQGSNYVTVCATIPSIHSLLKKLKDLNSEILRLSYPTISSGLTAAYEKLYKYYPIYGNDCGEMQMLYIATVLHPKYKLQYFETRESFPRALVNCIKKNLEIIFKLYEKYYGGQSLQNEEEKEFSFLSDTVYEDEKDELAAYLAKKPGDANPIDYYRRKKNQYPILYQLAKDIMATPALSVPSSFFSKLGDIITNKRNKFYPGTIKMLAIVKQKVSRIKPGDVELDVESDDDEKLEDDAELKSQVLREIDDNSDDEMEV